MECAHDMCTCMTAGGTEYCSTSCSSPIEGATRCVCGHEECAGYLA
jgi:hypothetical protein